MYSVRFTKKYHIWTDELRKHDYIFKTQVIWGKQKDQYYFVMKVFTIIQGMYSVWFTDNLHKPKKLRWGPVYTNTPIKNKISGHIWHLLTQRYFTTNAPKSIGCGTDLDNLVINYFPCGVYCVSNAVLQIVCESFKDRNDKTLCLTIRLTNY